MSGVLDEIGVLLGEAGFSEAETAATRCLQQLAGAIGFTYEFDLHLWTLRLHALRVELQTASRHAVDVARGRWGTLLPG